MINRERFGLGGKMVVRMLNYGEYTWKETLVLKIGDTIQPSKYVFKHKSYIWSVGFMRLHASL